MLLAKNDSSRIKSELRKLRNENRSLLKLIIDLYHYVADNFYKDVVITMIYRTQDEQDHIYRNNSRYQQQKFKSPHQFWHGIDIRSYNFTDSEINQIEDYLNSKYDKDNYYRWTARNHNVGHGDHFHIQYYKLV